MKIVIYGTGNYAEKFLERFKDIKRDITVNYFVETVKSKEKFHDIPVKNASELKTEDFDYLIIAVRSYLEVITYLEHNIISYDSLKHKIMRMEYFIFFMTESLRDVMPFQSVSLTCGLRYIADSWDEYIGKSMFDMDANYAETQIKLFFELTEKYYGKEIRNGIFFDIGANIGTTSLYVKKIINPGLRVIGIEAGKDNYDLFRVNCIINHEEKIEVEHIGFGKRNESKRYKYVKENPGSSNIVADLEEDMEEVEIMKLDDYLSHKKIMSKEIDYLWIDTEGFEADIIEGAMETLSSKKIPLMQEFNPVLYCRNNAMELYCENIKKIYSFFIDVNDYYMGKGNAIPTSELYDFGVNMMQRDNPQTDLFFF